MDDLITCAVFEQQNCLHTDAPDYFLDRILRIQPDLRKGIYKMNFGSKIYLRHAFEQIDKVYYFIFP